VKAGGAKALEDLGASDLKQAADEPPEEAAEGARQAPEEARGEGAGGIAQTKPALRLEASAVPSTTAAKMSTR
jgi:hypothetical protein